MRQSSSQRWVTGVMAAAVATAVLLGAAGCSSDKKPSVSPAAAITTSYVAFNQAVTAKNGPVSANLLTATSLTYYDGLRKLALDAGRPELSKSSALDQLTVLAMRSDIPVDTLRTGTPRDLVSAAVQNGVITGGSMPQQGLDQVKVSGDQATAVLKIGIDTTQVLPIRFTKESGVWKFDLTSLLQAGQASLNAAEKAQKMTPKQLVESVENTRYGQVKAKALWTPIGRS